MISLNFRDAPLDQVLGFYAELTGRTVIKAPGLNATITLRGQTRLTEEEAKQAIETVLAMHNITMVPLGDKFLKVVQAAAVRQEGIPTQIELPEVAFPEVDRLISQIVELKYVDFKEIQPIIQGLMHGYGKIQALERTNALLITDTANNLQRILEIIEYLDRPMIPKVETRIYELRYAEAGKVAAKLQELIQESQQKPTPQPQVRRPVTPPGVIRPSVTRAVQAQVTPAELAERGIIRGKVKMVSDDRTNILIIISPPENFAFFDKIVSVLDRPVEPEIVVKVVKLEYANAEEIASILNEFIGAAKAEKEARGVAAAEAEKPVLTRAQALEEYISKQAQRALQRATEAEKAVVLGGGLVGLKVAQALRKRGLKVHVVVKSPHLLSRQLDAQGGEILRRAVEEAGAELTFGQDAREVLGGPDEVILEDGRRLEAEMVVVAKGVRPRAELLEAAGGKVGRGVVVDERMQTSIPHIYAAGDVAEVPDLVTGERIVSAVWPSAVAQGRVAGLNMAGQELAGAQIRVPIHRLADRDFALR